MRYLLVLCLVACGDDPTAAPDANTSDASAEFCDGTPREIGTGIINAIAVDGSGRLVAVGTQFMPQPQTLFVRRLLASGEPDPTFGNAGLVTKTGAVTDGHSLLPRADGTILVGAGVDVSGNLKPIVFALTTDGQPTGFEVVDTASTGSVVDRIFAQGTSVVTVTDGILRRITATGEFDMSFGDNGSEYVGDGVAVTDSGFAAAVTQLSDVLTYRLTPDAMDIASSATMVDADVHAVNVVMSRDDRITFVGDVKTSTFGTYDLMVGRVLADNTFDTASYPPSGFAVLPGIRGSRAAVELSDDSILAAVDGGGMVHIKPDGTLDQMYSLPNANITSVAAWNGHFVAAGTLSGGHAIVACY